MADVDEALAAEMVTKLEGGETPQALGLDPASETGLNRDDRVAGAPDALTETAFGLEPGSWTVVEAEDGAVVLRVDAVNAADQTGEEAVTIKARFAGETAQALSQDLQDAFGAALETQAGITLDQAMINAVNAQFQ
ncbi:MAG: peptidyl-prolyl cis-trans isomerase [Maritimibacter sp.]|nr:peptidyl-prolyl cis-trans isomerase [Maritimibacter sp.]